MQSNTALKQIGATVRNAGSYMKQSEKMTKNVMGKMSVEQLSDLLSFYHTMGQICSQVLERKLHDVVNDFN